MCGRGYPFLKEDQLNCQEGTLSGVIGKVSDAGNA